MKTQQCVRQNIENYENLSKYIQRRNWSCDARTIQFTLCRRFENRENL